MEGINHSPPCSGVFAKDALESPERLAQVVAENEALRGEIARLAKFEQLAYHDCLTEVHNRRYYNERLAEEWSRATRYGEAFCLVIIDLDDFKTINDSAGHHVGDDVLRLVASALTDACRDCDVVCRIGGDEFAYILPETCEGGARRLMQRIVELIASSREATTLPSGLRIRLSYGVAAHAEASSLDGLIAQADAAMYAHKRATAFAA